MFSPWEKGRSGTGHEVREGRLQTGREIQAVKRREGRPLPQRCGRGTDPVLQSQPREPATAADRLTRVLLTGDRPRPTPRPGLISVRAQICREESGARGSSTASGCSGPHPAGRLSLDCSHQVEDQGVISQGEFQGLSHGNGQLDGQASQHSCRPALDSELKA